MDSKYKVLGLWNDLKNTTARKLEPLSQMTLTTVKNTVKKCRLCRGSGFNEVIMTNGVVIMKPCAMCKGKGVLFF